MGWQSRYNNAIEHRNWLTEMYQYCLSIDPEDPSTKKYKRLLDEAQRDIDRRLK